MARKYYKTVQEVYKLFTSHPSLSQMTDEFDISEAAVKEVAEFLVYNDDKIANFDLKVLYNWGTPSTLEPDQPSPLAIQVQSFSNLPEYPNPDRTYFVTNPYPGKYYTYDTTQDKWVENTNFVPFTRDQYEKYQQDTGHLIWENERGYFVFVEQEGQYFWQQLQGFSGGGIGSVIRKSDLPMTGVSPGDIYEVRGEDILDVIAILYGFVMPEYYPPWDQYVSQRNTNLLELLKFTIYYYRYATIDNFYETHIFDFIPEYDRNYILSKPKMKLFLEGVGRKLDDIEDRVSRIPNLYNLDEVPEELLDYVGQILGYEREDFSLANVSFRELLKNIIEIYKIKGTNYSFSFFFKFLGFNINLKEFYFDRDVTNPESFPGVDNTKVEYYLTTQNPIFKTENPGPAHNLEQIRDLNDWDFELEEIVDGGCNNPIQYLLGKESYNLAGRWHKNPWTYFKTNLVEYQLNPFMDKVNLTASDNKTIRKYVRFLSPTYLFTWINVNLNPWIDSYDVHTELEEKLRLHIEKTMGDYIDPETGDIYIFDTNDYLEKVRDGRFQFRGYEKMDESLHVYQPGGYYQWSGSAWGKVGQTSNLSGTVQLYEDLQHHSPAAGDVYRVYGGEMLGFSFVNYLNIGGDDQVGTSLHRDGIHIRQQGHPSHITDIRHDGAIKLNFDNLDILIKDYSDSSYDYTVPTFSGLPSSATLGELGYVQDENEVYIFKNVNYWEDLGDSYSGIIKNTLTYQTQLMLLENISDGDVYRITTPLAYFRYNDVPPEWVVASFSERFKNWDDYSFRSFPDTPNEVSPHNVEVDTNTTTLIWENIKSQTGYNIQIATENTFDNIVDNQSFNSNTTVYTTNKLTNNTYYWRIRVKNILDQWGTWSDIFNFDVVAKPYPYDGEILTEITRYIQIIKDNNNNITGVSFNLLWPESEVDFDVYHMQLSTFSDFSNPIYDIQTNHNTFAATNLPNNIYYYWRYRTRINGQWTNWTEYTFKTEL